MKRPLLSLSLFLACGALGGGELAPSAAALLLTWAALLLCLAWGAGSRSARWALAAASLGIGAALASAERGEYEAAPLRRWVEAAPPEGPVRVTGVAAADAWEARDRLVVVLDTERVWVGGRSVGLPGRARVSIGGEAERPEIIEGDEVSLWTTLRPPRGFGDPAADDVAERARRNGVHATGYCKSPRVVQVARPRPRRLSVWIARARLWARHALEDAVPGGPEQDVVRAMVLGDKAGLDDETAEAFRIAGTYHVLALSGTQVALLAALVGAAIALLRLPRGPGAVLLVSVVGAYAVLVGGDVPVVRAAIMTAVLVLGRVIDLDGDVANLLGLAAGIVLVIRPSSIGDPGFQLSFGATLGLVLLSGPLLQGVPRLPFRLDIALAASLAAQLALAPLLLRLFHRLAPAALILNLAAVPLSSAVLVAGIATLVATPLGPFAATRVGDAAWIAGHALIASGRVVEGVPCLDARFPTPVPSAVAVYLVALLWLASGRRRALALAATTASLGALLLGRPTPEGAGRLTLEVLDVGQGDCLVLRSPGGHVWLVDAGGGFDRPFDFGETVVGPHLWAEGIDHVERIVLTHAHPDHAGGVPFVVRSFGVGDVWEGPAPIRDPIYSALDRQLLEMHVSRRTVVRGFGGTWDGVGYEVLNPPPPGTPALRTRNDDSLVLRLQFGGVQLLLTGDIEGAAERRLGRLPATILKVPHHGSRTSSTPEFVRAVAPRLAIVSVGYKSVFGHPHAEVLDRYLKAGTMVFRTDLDGTVVLSTDGRSVWVRTARSGLDRRVGAGPPGL